MATTPQRRAAILVIDDARIEGDYEETFSLPIAGILEEAGFTTGCYIERADTRARVKNLALPGFDLVITLGRVGARPDDIVPEGMVLLEDCRPVPGIAEAVRAYGRANGVMALATSRGTSCLSHGSLVINLPLLGADITTGLVSELLPLIEYILNETSGPQQPT